MMPLDSSLWTRRGFLRGVAHTSALLSVSPALAAAGTALQTTGVGHIEPALTAFIQSYMQAMYAPGMTLALVGADGRSSTGGFGYSNVDSHQPVTPDMLFQIGSISKSFCALVLLQMHDEGKLDLHAPILDHLPWLPLDMPFGKISAHHLLTHSSGLPADDALFSPDRNVRIQQAYVPGKRFWYSNLGFEILGHLAGTIDGTSYAASLRKRILNPLGMMHTQPAISDESHSAEAHSYVLFRNLAGTRAARLTAAPPITLTAASGCISCGPADMATYLRMLIAGGAGPHGRLVSDESFRLFATPVVDASEEFGPGFGYGYGIAVNTQNGAHILKHTGGMYSFASSLQVDLNARVGAFASVNAMQGYRPNPVTTYALAVLRAAENHASIPRADPLDNPREIANATDYAGLFGGASGTIEVLADGASLRLRLASGTILLERAEGDTFVAADEAWQSFPWRFQREKPSTPDGKGAVTELFYGLQWYVTAAYSGPKQIAEPEAFQSLPGRYGYGIGFLTLTTQVYTAKGTLFLDGTPLEQIGEGLFRPTAPPDSPERIQFLRIVNGKAQLVLSSGYPFQRVEIS
jgi:D-alanyl-D-alanine carboxypeptidase